MDRYIKATDYAYTEVKNSFPELKGNGAKLMEKLIEVAYLEGYEYENAIDISKSAKDYAEKVINEKLKSYPEKTQKLISLFLQQSFIKACEDDGKDVAVERIDIATQLLSFN